MGKTVRGGKGPGYEYWSRRPSKGCTCPGKENKKITHKLERRQANKELKDQI